MVEVLPFVQPNKYGGSSLKRLYFDAERVVIMFGLAIIGAGLLYDRP
jgi:hypothetical protein